MIQTAKNQIANILSSLTQLSVPDLEKVLEKPKQFEHGHLAFPVFSLAKSLKKAPPQISSELASRLQEDIRNGGVPFLEKVEAAGGFLNFTFKNQYLQNIFFSSLEVENIGYSKSGSHKTVVIDYASPNVAKPMHVGHLRAAMVGQAIRNLAQSQGYNVIGVNHLGDWGSQFGKLAWAFQNWGSEYDFSEKPIDSWLSLYVRFHNEAENNPELERQGAATFKKLEDGDFEIHQIWQKIVADSLKDYDRLLNGLLKIKHDKILGESFYTDKMESVVQLLKEKNLLKDSEGAQVVFFDDKENMPPCIIKKSDGASIYATRDLATAIYRHDIMKADEMLYVVGQDQSLHFRQVFKVLEMAGFAWAQNCHHISFGLYRFEEGKMSTRKGRVILFEDVISEAIELVERMINEKNPGLENKELVTKQVAIGAVIFNDLLTDRMKNVVFDWNRILSMEGDSGPYVQYTSVRCKSILRKYGKVAAAKASIELSHDEERKLLFQLMQFEDVLSGAYRQFRPNILAQYLLEVCGSFSHFYHKCRIIGEAPEVESSRIALVAATEKILVQGLRILNIEAPEAM